MLIQARSNGATQRGIQPVCRAFSDETATSKNEDFFVGGYIANEALWGPFAEEWQRQILDRTPTIHIFKCVRFVNQNGNATMESARLNRTIDAIPDEVMEVLKAHDWPGNIRELQNFIERAMVFSPDSVLYLPLKDLKQMTKQPSDAAARLCRRRGSLPEWVPGLVRGELNERNQGRPVFGGVDGLHIIHVNAWLDF
jgi:hypothetical protein